MAVNRGFRGTIKVDTSHTLVFVGAWSADLSRDVVRGKPKITSTSTGNAPITPGAMTISGTLEGEILAGPDTDRNYVMTKFKDGTFVTLALEQEDGVLLSTTNTLISKVAIKTDSEAVPTLQFDWEAEDYTYDDDPDTP